MESDFVDPKFLELLEITLTEFIVEVMNEKPDNPVMFAANYFNNLVEINAWEDLTRSLMMGKLHHNSSSAISINNRTNSVGGSNSYFDRDTQRLGVSAQLIENHRLSHILKSSSTVLKELPKAAIVRKIKAAVHQVFIFRSLDDSELDTVVKAMEKRTTTAGEIIIREGGFGDFFYVVESGVYEAFIMREKEPVFKKRYDNEGSFGEIALLYNCPRVATVVTRTPGLIWRLERTIFQRVVLHKAVTKRRTYEIFLRNVELFSNMNDYELNSIADAIEQRTYEERETIVRQDETGNDMFIVESGQVSVIKCEYDIERELVRLGPGQYFGELSLIYDEPRKATVTATVRTTVLVIDRESFERLLGPCIKIMERNVAKYKEVPVLLLRESNPP